MVENPQEAGDDMNPITHPSARLPVTELQRFCMHDGPGVRTVVFFKGCPLRCAWCHNPETQRATPEMLFYESKCIYCGACVSACPTGAHSIHPERIFDRDKCAACGYCATVCCTDAITPAARDMTVEEILGTVLRDKSFYGDNGGITVSGGEPMTHPEGVIALLTACKEAGITTCVETCGEFSPAHLPALCRVTDLFLWDVKDTDPTRHKAYTGVDNTRILQNLKEADCLGAKTRLRCILVNGVNTVESHYGALAELYASLTHCEGIECIPYHAYGGSKMIPLGMLDNGRVEWIPHNGTVEGAKEFLRMRGITVIG
jgi:pyruvate formate lyase activating enzyme